eukprot:TRINITY_DN26799_c0_g1_i1.p1 TRINITY_DN26799_c0_g1~~TRINITY_DN26799_c0_g1_i1.p1  ORF type:complete len:299 (-),score=13.57 TRINITY_DN26799_c0_g1_i1:192-1088(-)
MPSMFGDGNMTHVDLKIPDLVQDQAYIHAACILILFLLCFAITCILLRKRESRLPLPVPEAVRTMYQGSHKQSISMPDKLRGIFWVSDDSSDALLLSVDGAYFDPVRRLLKVTHGGPNTLSWNTHVSGFLKWFYFTVIGSLCCIQTRIVFEDEYYLKGYGHTYVFAGFLPIPLPFSHTMSDVSFPHYPAGFIWEHGVHCWCDPRQTDFGIIRLRKVIDSNGVEVQPAMAEMLDDIYDTENTATYLQYVQVDGDTTTDGRLSGSMSSCVDMASPKGCFVGRNIRTFEGKKAMMMAHSFR